MNPEEVFRDRISDGFEAKGSGVFVRSEGNTDIEITVTTPDDPAQALLRDDFTTTPTVYWPYCYICNDPEFAQMGLPLCKPCPDCPDGHVPADDVECSNCGSAAEYEAYLDSRPEPSDELFDDIPPF